MTEFDALKAAREELAGLIGVQQALQQSEHEAEEAMAKAERTLNAVRKLTGYCKIEIDHLRARIDDLERKR